MIIIPMGRKKRPFYETVVQKNIRQAMKSTGMKQRELASKLGMTEQQLSDKLTGKTTCLDLIEPLASFFSIPPALFFLESSEYLKSPEEQLMCELLKEKGITEAKVLQYALSGDLYRLEKAIGLENIIELAKLLGRKPHNPSLKK